MNKFIAATAAVLMTTALAGTAFADSASRSDNNPKTDNDVNINVAFVDMASEVDLACMGAAVDTREGIVLDARKSFNAKIITALEARRTSFKYFYAGANNTDRKNAITLAMTTFAKAVGDARAEYKVTTKTAWKTFGEAIKKCRTDADIRVKEESKDDHDDNGRHLGQLKKQIKNAYKINNHGKVDMDLSL